MVWDDNHYYVIKVLRETPGVIYYQFLDLPYLSCGDYCEQSILPEDGFDVEGYVNK